MGDSYSFSSLALATGTIDDMMEPSRSPLEKFSSFLTLASFGHTFGAATYSLESDEGAVSTASKRTKSEFIFTQSRQVPVIRFVPYRVL